MPIRPDGHGEITLEDVDAAILAWFDRSVDARVKVQGDRLQKVPVVMSARERWVTATEDMVHRDKDGRIVFPAISIARTGIDATNGKLALGSNVPRLQISRRISRKARDLAYNHSQREMLSVEPSPVVYEVATIPFPFNGTAQYKFKVYAQYMLHVNAIVERIVAELEFFDVPCFVAPIRSDNRPDGIGPPGERQPAQEAPYELRQPLQGYYVCGYMEGDMSPESSSEEFTDQERMFVYTGQFEVPLYLLLDPRDKRQAVQFEQTSFRVDFGVESVREMEDDEIELIFGGGGIAEKVRDR